MTAADGETKGVAGQARPGQARAKQGRARQAVTLTSSRMKSVQVAVTASTGTCENCRLRMPSLQYSGRKSCPHWCVCVCVCVCARGVLPAIFVAVSYNRWGRREKRKKARAEAQTDANLCTPHLRGLLSLHLQQRGRGSRTNQTLACCHPNPPTARPVGLLVNRQLNQCTLLTQPRYTWPGLSCLGAAVRLVDDDPSEPAVLACLVQGCHEHLGLGHLDM